MCGLCTPSVCISEKMTILGSQCRENILLSFLENFLFFPLPGVEGKLTAPLLWKGLGIRNLGKKVLGYPETGKLNNTIFTRFGERIALSVK